MSELHYDLPPLSEVGRQAWASIIATSATDVNDRVYVTIPDFDPNLRWGPCRWQARDEVSLPVRGDSCLVILDNNNEPWVVAWWPFST